jgi:hypothetical protein
LVETTELRGEGCQSRMEEAAVEAMEASEAYDRRVGTVLDEE